MRKFAPLLVAAAIVLVGAGCTSTSTTTTDTNPPAQPAATAPAPAPTSLKGRAVFSITDDTAEIKGVTSVVVTIDKVEAHNELQGWITVSTTSRTYDLLLLKKTSTAQLLADANIATGTYDQVRLSIGKVLVTANGKTTEATLPSGTLKISGKLTVTAGQTSTAEFDFIADKSLHLTGDGKFILAPVVHMLTKQHASVKVDADEKIKVDGGDKETDRTDGMDVQGDMKADFELKDKLDIDAGGMVKVHGK